MTDSLLTPCQPIRFDGGMELHIPDGTFNIADLEKANAQLSALDVSFLLAGAIVDGRVQVLPPSEDLGKGFLYRRSENKK